MYPSEVEIPKWKFADGSMFGVGTTYENKIYHHFEGRKFNHNNIMNEKIKSILG